VLGVAAFAGAVWAGGHYFHMAPLTPAQVVLGTAVAVGAALAPDLDERHSLAGHDNPVSWFPIYGGHRQRTHWLLTAAVVALVAVLCQHDRAATAVLVGFTSCTGGAAVSRRLRSAGALLCVPYGVVLGEAAYRWVPGGWWLVAAVAFPYASHLLVGDLFTPGGEPLLGPFSKRKVSLPLFHVGGLVEALVVTPLVAGVALWSAYVAFFPVIVAFAHGGAWVTIRCCR
jgi:membrane-bound metal-dependent hydrolase YbcI (DUF457 family)